MRVLRTQELTPSVYTEESRDFQLLGRLVDTIVNGIKFDIDCASKVTDTSHIRSELLPLLQTKLGFFSNKNFDSESLRKILEAFPTLVKQKGTLTAVEQTVNMFLKILQIKTKVVIWSTKEPLEINGTYVRDHTVIIGIQTTMTDTTVLSEVFRYILPAGFPYYLYFYTSIEDATEVLTSDVATILFVSDNINNTVKSTLLDEELNLDTGVLDVSLLDRFVLDADGSIVGLIKNVNTSGVISFDENDKDDMFGKYNYIGVFTSLPSGNINDVCIVNDIMHIHDGKQWKSYNFKGMYPTLPGGTSEGDIVGINNVKTWFVKTAESWLECAYRGTFKSLSEVVDIHNQDIIRILPHEFTGSAILGKDKLGAVVLSEGQQEATYFAYINYQYMPLVYLGEYESFNKVQETSNIWDCATINGVTTYVFENDSWKINDKPIYVYKEAILSD